MTPLHLAVLNGRDLSARFLLNHPNIEINAVDKWGKTPLHIACTRGHFDIIKDLLSRDEIQVNCQDNLVFFIINGNTPLHILAGSNYIESFELLISDSRIDQTIKNKEGNTAKEIATIQENDEMLVLFEN